MLKNALEETSPPRYKTSNVILLSINAALGAVFFGYVLSVFNPTQRYIQEKVYPGISEHLIYLMTSFIPLGGAFGAVTSTSLASKYGRRKTMLLIDILSILGIILTIVPSQYVLLVGRLVCGVCIGLNSSLVPLYISEVSPIELKGVTGTFNQVFVSVGILVSYLLGLGIPSDNDAPYSNWWMFMLGIILIAPVVRLTVLAIFVRHETPKFLVQKHKDGEARDALAQTYKDRDEIEAQLEQIKKEIRYEEAKDGVTYKDLISPYYRRRFVTGCVLAVLQQACGINAIILYSTDIFRRGVLVSEDNAPQVYTVVVGVINLLSALMATVFVTGTGRKTLLIIGNVLLFLSLIVLSIAEFVAGSSGELSRYCIFLFILAFGFSLGSVTWFYLAEILPDLGIGVALLCNWVTCFVIAQGFPYMVEAIGDAGSFLIFGAICVAGLFFVIFCVKETRNKNSMEIADMFSKKKFNDNSEEAGLLAEEKRVN